MLQVKDISKQYQTGSLIQRALDHVSLNLRDNEFVAILGPSGSGKTTLLNIIGGLDRYDSGDLIINGISTKKYKDRDWDSYRNHTIGFVFQSYNLIPHQTVLQNVELALTISGISGSERKRRAIEALEKVGLGEQIHKKPNQMSGGQMQRVALARALVNNPDILLADEPTGALDSETSIQVMDLLKEVAKDRLVVMVTHNPELAEKYANRIVNLRDGHILSDTNPYIVDEEADEPPVHKNMGKSSMSFLTALSLSMNNLMTKKARTILVAFAGSIGIIGIALILSLSNGVNTYIHDTEEETLSEYPLEITKSSYNMTSMLNTAQETRSEILSGDTGETQVKERSVVSNMLGGVQTNDLKSFKEYIESDESDIDTYARSIEYDYDIEPQIYLPDTDDGVHQVNPNTLFTSSGLIPTSSIYSSAFSANVFSSLPDNEDLYKDSYDLKAGKWPDSYNEAVVVLSVDGAVTDMTLYSLGIKEYSELEALMEAFQKEENTDVETSTKDYQYSDFIGVTLKLVNASDTYVYDDSLKVYSSKADDTEFMKDLIENGEDIKIVGVVEPKDDANAMMLTAGIAYSSDLCEHLIDYAKDSEVVKAQLEDPDINVLTGEEFGKDETLDLDFDSMFTIDEKALENAFDMDTSKLNINIADYLDTSSLSDSLSIPEDTLQTLLQSASNNVSQAQMQQAFSNIFNSYLQYLYSQGVEDPYSSFKTYMNSAEAKTILMDCYKTIVKNADNIEAVSLNVSAALQSEYKKIMQELPEDQSFEDYIQTPEGVARLKAVVQTAYNDSDVKITDLDVQNITKQLVSGYLNTAHLTADTISQDFSSYLSTAAGQSALEDVASLFINVDELTNSAKEMMTSTVSSLTSTLTSSINKAITKMVNQIPNALSIDADAFSNAFEMNMDMDELEDALMSMMTSTSESYEDNLSAFAYADLDDPYEIVIYPSDFEAKEEIIDILDAYNTKMEDTDQDKVITYTDIVGTLMTSVTDIVNTISYVLIAFVAISLVVSSIMIGVITYISVLERQKEIGILRAMGASKHNISNVFNAETFITGLLAGAIGIGLTLLLIIPTNMIIHSVTNANDVNAALPFKAGILLILLSIVLTLIGGIIPSKKAANSDPVKALRTD